MLQSGWAAQDTELGSVEAGAAPPRLLSHRLPWEPASQVASPCTQPHRGPGSPLPPAHPQALLILAPHVAGLLSLLCIPPTPVSLYLFENHQGPEGLLLTWATYANTCHFRTSSRETVQHVFCCPLVLMSNVFSFWRSPSCTSERMRVKEACTVLV